MTRQKGRRGEGQLAAAAGRAKTATGSLIDVLGPQFQFRLVTGSNILSRPGIPLFHLLCGLRLRVTLKFTRSCFRQREGKGGFGLSRLPARPALLPSPTKTCPPSHFGTVPMDLPTKYHKPS